MKRKRMRLLLDVSPLFESSLKFVKTFENPK